MFIKLNLSTLRISGKEESVKTAFEDISKIIDDLIPDLGKVEKVKIISIHGISDFGPATMHINPTLMNEHEPVFLQQIFSYFEKSTENQRLNLYFCTPNWRLQKNDVELF